MSRNERTNRNPQPAHHGGGRGRTVPVARVLVLMLALGAILAPLGGCGPGGGDGGTGGPGGETGPIKVGAILPLTGPQARFGQAKEHAYRLAMDNVNTAGGVKGRKLELVVLDSGGTPQAAAEQAGKLCTEHKVALVLGEYSSSCAEAVATACEEHKVPYLIDTAPGENLTRKDAKYVFRLNPPASLAPAGLFDFLAATAHPATLAILREAGEFGDSAAASARTLCSAQGIRVTADETYPPGEGDFKPLLAKLQGDMPDIVYLVSLVWDAAALVRQAREVGFEPKLFAGGAAGLALPEFARDAGADGEYLVVPAPWSDRGRYKGQAEFVAAYKESHEDEQPPTYHAAQAYAAMQVAADALGRVRSLRPADVREALSATDLETVYGRVKFEAFAGFTNQNRPPTVVLQVLEGVHEVIWPAAAAGAEPVYPMPGWKER